MLQAISLCKPEDIERSKQLVIELASSKIIPQKREEFLAELERLTSRVLNKIITEILGDLNNNLAPLYRGHFLKSFNEKFKVEVENCNDIERWGWVVEIVNGEKKIYDPRVDEDQRKYKTIPKMTVEKVRTVYVVESNRQQIWKIQKLIEDLWKKCKSEFHNVSIDKILEAKRQTEIEISQVDRTKMTKENFNETEFSDCEFIRKPIITQHSILGHNTDADLFKRFDNLKGNL